MSRLKNKKYSRHFLISKFLQLKPKDQHIPSKTGFASHARQAKNGQPTSRYFPSSSLGKTPRKLELPEQVIQAGAWVTAYFSFCDYDWSLLGHLASAN
ncbi:hypothetical protein [Methylotuvimicrobium buryatense]|uniref:hypothetical protein n=1 Tax=Methylotuvimicrobium buryatense TaxID=95641 RepID=UPI001181B2EF|nr:hypothetical protein [Methylotuvimicrobium buryatense]